MRKKLIWFALVASLLIATYLVLNQRLSLLEDISPVKGTHGTTFTVADFQKQTEHVFDNLPDGVHVSADQFGSRFGAQTASELASDGVMSLENSGGHITMLLASEYERDLFGVDVIFGTDVEFDLSRSTGEERLENIQGIHVQKNSLSGNLQTLGLGRDSAGNHKVKAHVKLWGVIPMNYVSIVGPDGRPLSKKR